MTRWFHPSTLDFTSSSWNQSRFRTKKTHSSKHHRHVKNYQLLRELTQGSTCTIYLALDTKTKKRYAIKEISMTKLQRQLCMDWLQARNPKQQQADGCKRRRIHSPPLSATTHCTESILLQSLHHDNIIKWVDCFEENNHLYLVTEWIEGSVLVDLRKDDDGNQIEDTDDAYHSFDPSTLRSIFTQLVRTLQYLHEEDIIHGDIKPDNILLTKTNQTKLIDFGSAIRLNTSTRAQFTQRRRTPAFTPPECNGNNKKEHLIDHHDPETIKHYETAADIWSLGLTLYCMVYGKLPYHSEVTSANHMELYGLLSNLTSIPHQDYVNQDLCNLMDQMLTVAPLERITLDQIMQHPWFLNKSSTDTTTLTTDT
ncbi:kinase-like domain-containing protein [Absidia repens]|uniref:non-specific serine/threonine protein kinase n=1 Tax=Absidia repens TaxID=90262 RepID=A0A1X2I7G8_9FUNG|nr:kinase-like domain-containing protein [Absidia repens]